MIHPEHNFVISFFLLESVVDHIDFEFIIVVPKKVVSVAAQCLLPEDICGIKEGGCVLCLYFKHYYTYLLAPYVWKNFRG